MPINSKILVIILCLIQASYIKSLTCNVGPWADEMSNSSPKATCTICPSDFVASPANADYSKCWGFDNSSRSGFGLGAGIAHNNGESTHCLSVDFPPSANFFFVCDPSNNLSNNQCSGSYDWCSEHYGYFSKNIDYRVFSVEGTESPAVAQTCHSSGGKNSCINASRLRQRRLDQEYLDEELDSGIETLLKDLENEENKINSYIEAVSKIKEINKQRGYNQHIKEGKEHIPVLKKHIERLQRRRNLRNLRFLQDK